jgi:prophage regulatory protein
MQQTDRADIDPLLSEKQVTRITGKGRTSIHMAMKAGDFPLPIKTGKRSVAWRPSDIKQWIDSRPVAARGACDA